MGSRIDIIAEYVRHSDKAVLTEEQLREMFGG